MIPYCIRYAAEPDLPRMLEVFSQAKEIMRADGNLHQWTDSYPSVDMIRRDIDKGVSYVIEDNGIVVGTFAFVPGIEPTYGIIEAGAWLDDAAPYATIHRLASTPDSHGIAETCFSWCSERCRNLRIDTHRDNHIMQHCILKAGFRYCGIIHLANGDERLAYQKL